VTLRNKQHDGDLAQQVDVAAADTHGGAAGDNQGQIVTYPILPAAGNFEDGLTKRQSMLKKFKCPCKKNCISQFDSEAMLNQLVYYESLTPAEKDMVVLGVD